MQMIKNFKHDWLNVFWDNGKHRRVPSELAERLLRKLDVINRATSLDDLKAPPSNHLHRLKGDREGQWAISVNGPWRVCFRFETDGVYDVELVQYH